MLTKMSSLNVEHKKYSVKFKSQVVEKEDDDDVDDCYVVPAMQD